MLFCTNIFCWIILRIKLLLISVTYLTQVICHAKYKKICVCLNELLSCLLVLLETDLCLKIICFYAIKKINWILNQSFFLYYFQFLLYILGNISKLEGKSHTRGDIFDLEESFGSSLNLLDHRDNFRSTKNFWIIERILDPRKTFGSTKNFWIHEKLLDPL